MAKHKPIQPKTLIGRVPDYITVVAPKPAKIKPVQSSDHKNHNLSQSGHNKYITKSQGKVGNLLSTFNESQDSPFKGFKGVNQHD